jgi:hypothetical protein
MENHIKQQLEIHYYFDDGSHTMDAFVRNRAEKDLLDAIKRVGYLLDNDALKIETQAYQEGGLIEFLAIGVPVLHYLAPSLNSIISHYFTKDKEKENLDHKIKQETLKSLQINNQKKELELIKEIEEKLSDKLVTRSVSNFYKKIDNYYKVTKIGFKDVESEYIVEKESFKDFILVDDTTVEEDDNASIEIISPVLKEGKFKWRGKYRDEKIDFSMGDSKFKEEVIGGKHKFVNGSFISANLQITITYDDFGDEKRKSYSVKNVYGIQESALDTLKLRLSGKKKKKQERQGSLFNKDELNESSNSN